MDEIPCDSYSEKGSYTPYPRIESAERYIRDFYSQVELNRRRSVRDTVYGVRVLPKRLKRVSKNLFHPSFQAKNWLCTSCDAKEHAFRPGPVTDFVRERAQNTRVLQEHPEVRDGTRSTRPLRAPSSRNAVRDARALRGTGPTYARLCQVLGVPRPSSSAHAPPDTHRWAPPRNIGRLRGENLAQASICGPLPRGALASLTSFLADGARRGRNHPRE